MDPVPVNQGGSPIDASNEVTTAVFDSVEPDTVPGDNSVISFNNIKDAKQGATVHT